MRALALATVLAAVGCHGHPGAPQREETRQVAPFTAVEVSGAIGLHAVAGAAQAVKVKADEDLLSHLHTDVKGGVLTIDTEGVSFSTAPQVELAAPKLLSIVARGATRIRAEGFDNDALTLDLSGAANLTVAGKCKQLSFKTQGASRIDARSLVADSVSFDGSGACSAQVTATHALDATLSGACRLAVFGHPAQVKQHTSGASSIDMK